MSDDSAERKYEGTLTAIRNEVSAAWWAFQEAKTKLRKYEADKETTIQYYRSLEETWKERNTTKVPPRKGIWE